MNGLAIAQLAAVLVFAFAASLAGPSIYRDLRYGSRRGREIERELNE